jgi:hypothetical protein
MKVRLLVSPSSLGFAPETEIFIALLYHSDNYSSVPFSSLELIDCLQAIDIAVHDLFPSFFVSLFEFIGLILSI